MPHCPAQNLDDFSPRSWVEMAPRLQRVGTGKAPLILLFRTWHLWVEQAVDGIHGGKDMKWHQRTFGLERDREQKEVREQADSLRAWEALETCAEGQCWHVHCVLHVCNVVCVQ